MKSLTVWSAALPGQKAVDIVAVDAGTRPTTCWMIEAKDFRVITNPPKPSNIGGLAQTIVEKVRHSIAGLTDAAASATNVGGRHAPSACSRQGAARVNGERRRSEWSEWSEA